MSNKPVIVGVSGVKNSGKTTLLKNVIPLLKEMGLHISVIKHDAHDFIPDVPNTDSYMLREAGANNVAVFSDQRFMLIKDAKNTTIESMLDLMPEAELVLIEGAKHTPYPKIEVFRTENSKAPVCDQSTLIGLYTDSDLQIPGIESIKLGDYKRVAQIIYDKVRG